MMLPHFQRVEDHSQQLMGGDGAIYSIRVKEPTVVLTVCCASKFSATCAKMTRDSDSVCESKTQESAFVRSTLRNSDLSSPRPILKKMG